MMIVNILVNLPDNKEIEYKEQLCDYIALLVSNVIQKHPDYTSLVITILPK